MKKMLMLASVASMIDQFNMPNIQLLQEMGYEVHVACNFEEGNTCSKEKILDLKRRLKNMEIKYYQIDFSRSVSNLKKNLKAYRQVYVLMKREQYQFVHCHSPIGGVIGRLVGHRTGTKVIYTAHGFHFFKGAPLKNWILYYPIEKFLSRYTEVIITINKEDYRLAKDKFHMKNLEYISGVGVDTKRFIECNVSKQEKRKELGIPEEAFLLLSVGELSERKNHKTVINALGRIQDPNIYYVIAGTGELYDDYLKDINAYGISKQVLLLGPRTDVEELCKAADVFIHPSIREGLGIAPLEGMASGLALISSYVNGIKDYTKDGITGCCIKKPLNVQEMKSAILKMRNNDKFRISCAQYNKEIAKKFDVEISKQITKKIYCLMDNIETYLYMK